MKKIEVLTNKYDLRRLLNYLLMGRFLKFRSIFSEYISDFYEGYKIKFKYDSDIGKCIYYNGKFENDELEICKKYINYNSIVIDIGANIGLHSIYFSKLSYNGYVLSFEPSSDTYSLLTHNVRDINNIIPINVGLSNLNCIADFFVATDNAYSGLKDTKRKTIIKKEKILCNKLDDIIYNIGFENIDFIKIDVEGFEYNVLQGMAGIIEKYKPVVFCEIYKGVNSNQDPEETIDYLLKKGYSAFVSNGGILVEYKIHSDRLYNYFFIPKN